MTTLATESPPYAELKIGRHPLPPGFEVTDEFMREVQELNPDKIVECWKNKELVITVGAGGNASGRGFWLSIALGIWIRIGGGGGHGAESSQGFLLPDGTRHKPDLSWIDEAALRLLRGLYESTVDWPEYLPVVPTFIVEIASPSDKQRDDLAQQRAKCAHWVGQGVSLAWLIDPFDGVLHIYRPGMEVEKRNRPLSVEAGPEMPGFVVDMVPIWE